jgi:hypothetical protein
MVIIYFYRIDGLLQSIVQISCRITASTINTYVKWIITINSDVSLLT